MSIKIESQQVFVVERHGFKFRFFTKNAAISRLAKTMAHNVYEKNGFEIYADYPSFVTNPCPCVEYLCAVERTTRRLKKLLGGSL